jgi:hypothetical protein
LIFLVLLMLIIMIEKIDQEQEHDYEQELPRRMKNGIITVP